MSRPMRSSFAAASAEDQDRKIAWATGAVVVMVSMMHPELALGKDK